MNTKEKKEKRDRRRKRIRAKIFGTPEKPRLSVFRSNKYIYAALINDVDRVTLASISSKSVKGENMKERAMEVGKQIAKKALAKKISLAVFDRGGYLYSGSIASVALGAREAGLKF